ncbi:ATP-binding protein [Pediococcus claussenii]|uniref:YhaN AAA domain-containing protein n=1 Tax=Pediococcus claussenii (strain ATCC BAA-344 / DSM 14800 / JCM 18046 / KCTC 3811 / LMG 21948 / P06) TaxID=701521 RepID=G8PDT3_PEDCP|nr:AAA family ATPase [Pediococcus claussenii]AEV95418.1 hypothetical protein PECL_1156 [Pediococcus claussenii ATCC BAA-344]ANZ68948.1 hypothetical protein AYR57_00800 [Pediococcus claussenii]ANZ70764.1 hypothetical protein AYR58_00800 [Pediococcus claussenii]KRN19061.1 hypothetical protein IV79_GL001723 [Pediococcus claussenii]
MKIKKIEIYGFGKWNNVEFNLDEQLQLFFGKNEAGKSTLRQFIISILFGFSDAKGKNKFNQYKPHSGAAYGGNLTVEYDGGFYQIERIDKPKKNTVNITNLTNGEKVDNGLLDEILGQVDLVTYREFFGFNQDDLELIQNVNHRTLQERIMRMGAVGGHEWFSLEDKLDSEANTLYKVRGQKPIINQLLKKVSAQEQLLNKEREELPQYDALIKVKQENQNKVEHLREEQNSFQGKLDQLENVKKAWNKIERMNILNSKITESKFDIPSIDTEEESINWQKYQSASQQVEKLKLVVQGLNTKINQNTKDNDLNLTSISNQIPAIKLQIGQREDYKRRTQRIIDSIDEIKSYGPSKIDISNVKELDENDNKNLQQLLLTKSRKESEVNQVKNQILSMPKHDEKNILLNPFLIGAAIWSILDLLLPISSLIKGVLLILAWGGAIALGLRQRATSGASPLQVELENEERQLDEVHQNLAAIGKQAGMMEFDVSEWTVIQNLVFQLKKSKTELQVANSELNKLNEDINSFWKQVHSINQLINIPEDEKGLSEIQKMQFDTKQVEHDVASLKGQMMAQSDQLDLQSKKKEESFDKLKLHFTIEQIDSGKIPALISEARQFQEAKKEFDSLKKAIDKEQLDEYNQFENIRVLNEQINSLQQQIQQNQQRQNELLDERSDKTGEISGLISRNEIQELEQDLEETKANLADHVHEWLVDKIAKKWIDETLEKATHGRLPEVITSASEYFNILTNGRYDEIKIGNQTIEVKRSDNHEKFELGELSRGTTDQLYISLRFAFVKIVSSESKLPLIIDDGFVSFDSDRTVNVFNIINKLSQEHQVIYLTSNEDIKKLSNEVQVLNLI